MIGLQEMLLQTIGDQIVLFPAWPKDWAVDFKLHAPDFLQLKQEAIHENDSFNLFQEFGLTQSIIERIQ